LIKALLSESHRIQVTDEDTEYYPNIPFKQKRYVGKSAFLLKH